MAPGNQSFGKHNCRNAEEENITDSKMPLQVGLSVTLHAERKAG